EFQVSNKAVSTYREVALGQCSSKIHCQRQRTTLSPVLRVSYSLRKPEFQQNRVVSSDKSARRSRGRTVSGLQGQGRRFCYLLIACQSLFETGFQPDFICFCVKLSPSDGFREPKFALQRIYAGFTLSRSSRRSESEHECQSIGRREDLWRQSRVTEVDLYVEISRRSSCVAIRRNGADRQMQFMRLCFCGQVIL